MTTTTQEFAMNVLLKRRDELVAAVADAEALVESRRQDVEHIEAAIRLIAEPKPEIIAKIRRRGDLSRLLRKILKDAPKPLSAQVIAERYLVLLGAPPPTREQFLILMQAVRRSLIKLKGRGVVTPTRGPGNRYVWQLSESLPPPHTT